VEHEGIGIGAQLSNDEWHALGHQSGDASYLGTTSPYYINNGKIVTGLAGTPIEVTAYKLGDKYYGARSNEFGYANYEIIPEVKELNPLGPGKIELR